MRNGTEEERGFVSACSVESDRQPPMQPAANAIKLARRESRNAEESRGEGDVGPIGELAMESCRGWRCPIGPA